MLLYALSGLCCGIAAIIVISLSTSGAADHGDLYELDAIAAAIIGGTALTGGRGTIVGSLLGVLIFTRSRTCSSSTTSSWSTSASSRAPSSSAAVLVQQFRVAALRQPRPDRCLRY